jgi:hypothetical protein
LIIEDLEAEFPELSRLALHRPRVSSEVVTWAFISALGAGFIASGVMDAAVSVFSPLLLPPTQPHPEWLTTFFFVRAVQLVAMGAVALRAGGIATLALCFGYEALLFIAQTPSRNAFCEVVGRQPDPSVRIPCDLPSIVLSTWPTWAALIAGGIGSRWLLPPATAGSNVLLRGAGAFTLMLTAAGAAYGVIVTIVRLPGSPSTDQAAITANVVVDAVFLIIDVAAGIVAGVLLRRARSAAVLLLALLVIQHIDFGLTLMRTNIDRGVPHPRELAFLQSTSVLGPALAVLGIATGRLLARRRRNLVVNEM